MGTMALISRGSGDRCSMLVEYIVPREVQTKLNSTVRCFMKARVAICFLVVNKMEALPEISISSAYERTNADIFIGYLDQTDLPALRASILVNPLLLRDNISDSSFSVGGKYSDFSEDAFYKIVQYKWQLLQRVFELNYDYVIYSDTDVYWNLNPISEILNSFEQRTEVHVQIQSFTDLPSQPKLCMGFVAFRNSPRSRDFIDQCQRRHAIHSKENGRIGDDDIVTQFYIDNGFPNSILELPQTTFPVGRMLKLYSKQSKFPGLPSPIPFIFHANYVIGLRNKLILMKLFMTNYSINDTEEKLGVNQLIVLQLQRFRLFASRLKKIFRH